MIRFQLRRGLLFSLTIGLCFGAASAQVPDKPRVIVLTDISNEPDDEQSMVRLLCYANNLDLEALVATTSCWLRNRTAPEKIIERIEAYRKVRENFTVHATGWPEADHLLKLVKTGVPKFGMEGVGKDHDSPGSNFIIEVVDRDDPRPVYVSVWGGANCLAQALWKVKQTRSPEALEKFVAKLRVYTISDQDNAGPWMRNTFPDLFYIVSPGYEENHGGAYHFATWVGISGDKFHGRFTGPDFSIVDNPWLEKHIRQNHGPLGALHPHTKYLMEGDTPSFFWLIPNGLNEPEHPDWGGWGGRYELYTAPPQRYYHEPETRPIWTNAMDEVKGVDGQWHTSNHATIWRWREGYQHDFAARIDWSNTPKFEDANHPPVVVVSGKRTKNPVRVTAKPGSELILDAEGTSDPDGDSLTYHWYPYREAGTLPLDIHLRNIQLHNTRTPTLRVTLPKVKELKTVHLILEVKDDGVPALTSYRRVIVAIDPAAASAPPELESIRFSGPDITPCPACLCAAPTGELFVGVDMLGSLGKGPGKGRIVRLVDSDGDGQPESHSVYAEVDNPRGLISVGTQLFVLHTVIPKSSGKLEAMHLSVFEDKNWDGEADGKGKILVSNVSPPKHNQDRGADHTTNGIRMGIDGWIYIAVGDFGISGAKGADGTELTMLGGGVVRVRPDGSEMEVYTHGLRNIYDIAIDPFLNIYTRGNTNDGGGWNIRFIHHIQSGEYGYPVLFKNFTDEIIPALADLGGGSGTGALFMQEPGWPAKFNNVPLMCDWGRSELIIHRLTPDGASFTQKPEKFIKLAQIADVDVDGSGRLYGAAWDGAGYSGSPDRGFVQRYVPTDWTYRPFANPASLKLPALIDLLRSDSATARLAASQELIAGALSKDSSARSLVASLAADKSAPLETRVAAIFTYKQMAGAAANSGLSKLLGDPAVKEWALRALTDRKSELEGVSKTPFVKALEDSNPRVQVAAAVGLGRLGDRSAAPDLLAVTDLPGKNSASNSSAPPAFQSKTIGKKERVDIDVDITGFQQIYLTVGDGGNGTGNDHAAWFDPVFEDAAGTQLKLKDFKWRTAQSGWGRIGFGISATGATLKTADGVDAPDGLGTHSDSLIVFDVPKGAVRFKATGGIASTGGGSVQFAVSSAPTDAIFGAAGEGPHATPNSDILLPHVAVKALVDLQAVGACVDAVGGPHTRGALWALRKMHDPRVIDGLITSYGSAASRSAKEGILKTLIRLYHKEPPYGGDWWWGTRPDTRGPYYKLAKWDASDKIEAFVQMQFDRGDADQRQLITEAVTKNRAGLKGIETTVAAKTEIKPADPTIDLEKIASKKGQVGKMSIEDVMLSLAKLKGNPEAGKQVFTTQGCIACHTTEKGQPLKGPFMGQVGAVLSPEQIAESILKPNASISQGFATVLVETEDGKSMVGFVTAESADEIELRDITGKATKVKTSQIKKRTEQEVSMMPAGLANALSLDEFASLVAYLASQKG